MLTDLQLIKGSNNHCSKNHTVRCKAIEIIFYDHKQHCFNTYTIAVQYCEKCKRYFDFYNSFTSQLKMYHIPTNALHINCYDQHHRKIKYPSQTLSYEL